MRVIAGTAKGRKMTAPAGHAVRPTPSRVREAIFSILGPDVHGARVLDLYCGAGTLGIEALSRGAKAAVFVDRSRRTLAYVRRNLEATGFVAASTCVRRELPEQIGSDLGGGFRIVFSDPPYASDPVERLGELLAAGLVTDDAVWVHEGAAKAARGYEIPNWRQHEPRRYGATAIWLFDYAG